MHAHVVALSERLGSGGSVGKGVPEVLVLQHLPELLGAPLGEEELQARLVAEAPVPVVAEDLRHPVPGVGDPVGSHERAEPLTQPGRRRQAAADPQVVTDAELGVLDCHEGHVVDLVHDVLARVPGDGRLELAGQVGQRGVADESRGDLVDLRSRVDELVGGDARDGRAQHDARHISARFGRAETDGFEPAPDLRHRLDLDPVQLDVLAVGQVSGVAPELGGDAGDDPQLLGRELAAVDADAQHEELVLELVRLEARGAASVDPRLALGVQAPHAETPAQVGGIDRGEAALGVDVLDALADGQPVVDLLPLLIAVERGRAVDLPLAVRLGRRTRCAGPRSFCRDAGSALCRAVLPDVADGHDGLPKSRASPGRARCCPPCEATGAGAGR